MNAIDWNTTFALEILPTLLRATAWTLVATISSFALAVGLGLLTAILCDARRKTVSWPVRAVVDFVKGTPLLIQLYMLYFMLPSLGLTLPALLVGIMALGTHYAAYMCETYRAGLASVPSGQHEAAAALGLPRSRTFLLIVLPQALRPILPAMGNYLIFLFKETPLLSAVAIVELLQTAKLIGSETFRYTEPFTLVGLIFLALSLTTSSLLKLVQWKVSLARRS